MCIRDRLRAFAIDRLREIGQYKNLFTEDVYDLHNQIFNEDYYIVGYYQAQQWIGSDAFQMIGDIQQFERDNLGECHTKLDNAETVANHWVYWQGQELIQEAYDHVIESLGDEEREEMQQL